jgi:hypothetical protein
MLPIVCDTNFHFHHCDIKEETAPLISDAPEYTFQFDFRSQQHASAELDEAFCAATFKLAPPHQGAEGHWFAVVKGRSLGIYKDQYVFLLVHDPVAQWLQYSITYQKQIFRVPYAKGKQFPTPQDAYDYWQQQQNPNHIEMLVGILPPAECITTATGAASSSKMMHLPICGEMLLAIANTLLCIEALLQALITNGKSGPSSKSALCEAT